METYHDENDERIWYRDWCKNHECEWNTKWQLNEDAAKKTRMRHQQNVCDSLTARRTKRGR